MVALLVALTGCAHAQARTIVAGPALDVPAPPPRTVEAAAPVSSGAPAQGDATSPVSAPTSPPAQTGEPSRHVVPRPAQARPATPPRIDEPVAADPAKAPPAQTLQTTPAQQDGEVEARIRAVLSRAGNDLNRVDYARLNANLKNQYDQARRFVSLSEEAIRAKNLVYAGTLADKAAELAVQLAGR